MPEYNDLFWKELRNRSAHKGYTTADLARDANKKLLVELLKKLNIEPENMTVEEQIELVVNLRRELNLIKQEQKIACKQERKFDKRRKLDDRRVLEFFSYMVPRKNREAIMGDLREDIVEMSEKGYSGWYITFIMVKELVYALITQWPSVLKIGLWAWLGAKVKQWIS